MYMTLSPCVAAICAFVYTSPSHICDSVAVTTEYCLCFSGSMVPHRGRRATVRVYSAVAAILVMFVFGYLSRHHDNPPGNAHKRSLVNTTSTHLQSSHTRHLLSHPGDGYHSDKLSDDDTSDCHNPLHPPMGYNDSCWYVRDHCSGKTSLINYLSFIMCDLSHVKVRVVQTLSYCLTSPPPSS